MNGGCGCRKQPEAPPLPEVYTNRANDKAYIESLLVNDREQRAAALLRYQTTLLMTQCVLRVQAVLPPDAGGDALEDALAADAEWQRLVAQAEEQDKAIARIYDSLKDTIQNRMLEEQQAMVDVENGKAVAADKPRVGRALGQ